MQPVILLFGMPRSGTTWIAKILDSHPDTLYRHEPDSFGSLNHIPYAPSTDEVDRYRAAVREYVERLPAMRATKIAGSLPQFPKRYRSALGHRLHLGAVSVAKVAALAFGEAPVLRVSRREAGPDVAVVWKSIESLTRLPLLARALERRRAIVLLRHPCGHAASSLRGEAAGRFTGEANWDDWGVFETLMATPPARRRGLTLERLRACTPVERLTWLWLLSNEVALEGIQGVEGCSWLRYEDVCDDPDGGAKRLLEMAGLAWDAQTADFIRKSTSEHDDAYYSVFKDPRRAAYSWKKELSADQIAQVRGVLAQSALAALYPE
jgi:hypothetical protein